MLLQQVTDCAVPLKVIIFIENMAIENISYIQDIKTQARIGLTKAHTRSGIRLSTRRPVIQINNSQTKNTQKQRTQERKTRQVQ